ncbi:RNase P/RNase MRP complex subunit [Chytriomyces hyalinus]|nr:RNase P/RNase MRP complex subunit [Chytriomyces hyalinus]
MDLPLQRTLYETASQTLAAATTPAHHSEPATENIAASMLSVQVDQDGARNAVTAGRRFEAVADMKLRGKVAHLDNPIKDPVRKLADKTKNEERKKGKFGKKRRKKTLTRKEKIELGDIGKPKGDNLSYALFVPLHKLWLGYMSELFAGDAVDSFKSEQNLTKIVKADFHGAVFTVVDSKSKPFVGISGIMIKETENMFYIMTRENVVKGVPKINSNFTFVYSGHLFTLYGNHLKGSAADRVTKKLRYKPTVEL